MRLIGLFLIVLITISNNARAQHTPIDSLLSAISYSSNDTLKIKLYNQCSFYYAESDWDSTIYFLDKGLLLCKKINQQISEAIFLDNKGYIFMQMGKYSKALQSELLALKIAESPTASNAGDSDLKEDKKIKRLNTLSNIHYNLGLLYGATADTAKQIENFQKAIEIANSIGHTTKQAEVKLSLGSTYLAIGKLDEALLLEKEAFATIDAAKATLTKKYMGTAAWTIGQIFAKKQQRDSARKYYLQAMQLNKKYNNVLNGAEVSLSLAKLHKALSEWKPATQYAWDAFATYKNIGRQQGMADALTLLSTIYSTQNKTDSALKLLQAANMIKDSIRHIERDNLNSFQNVGFDEQLKIAELEKQNIQTQNKVRTYSLLAGLAVFLAIALILFRNNKQKQLTNKKLETTLHNLKSAQAQLIQSEKMASLGELTAGIAHEIQNPLNFVNNFSELSRELLEELKSRKSTLKTEEQEEILDDIDSNLEKINHHGKRADGIVKGMLQHSQSSSGKKEPTDINKLADEYLKLSYHGFLAKGNSFNAAIKTDFDESIGNINIIPQDIGRVLLNLFNNAFYAVKEKALSPIAATYEPTVSISTKKINDTIEIKVSDNGNGIPSNIVDKIFQPFFTTKPTGQGTGLGLSLSYDIVTKGHAGELKVESKAEEGSTFVILLPI